MAVHRRFDVFVIVLGIAALFAWASIHSEFHLRPQMPAEFFNPADVPPARRAAEQKVAQAYWKLAIDEIQWQYGYARTLPEQPPGDFFIRADEAGADALDPELRARYWQRLRHVWNISTLWERHYEWSTVSITKTLQITARWLQEHLRRALHE